MSGTYGNKRYPQFDERKTLYELYHPGNSFYYCNVTNQFGDDPADRGGWFRYNDELRSGGSASEPGSFIYTSDDLPTLTALDNQKFPNSNGPTYYYYEWRKDGGVNPLAWWTPTNQDYDIVPPTPNSLYIAYNELPSNIQLLSGTTCLGTSGGSYLVHDGFDEELLSGASGDFDFLFNRCNGSYTIQAIPDAGYRFLRWSDNNTTNPRTITTKGDLTLHAVYTPHLLSDDAVSDIESIGPTSVNSQRKLTSNDYGGGTILYHQVYTACGSVFYNHSTDDGLSWSDETQLSFTGMQATNPSIHAYGDSVWVVWNNPGNGLELVKFHYLDPSGLRQSYYFSNVTPPRDDSAPVVSGMHAVGASHIVVAYEAQGTEIEYVHFWDGHMHETGQVSLYSAADIQRFPALSVSGNLIELAWHDAGDVRYRCANIIWNQYAPSIQFNGPEEIVDLAGAVAVGAPSIAPNVHNSGIGLGCVVATETAGFTGNSGVTVTMRQSAGWSNPQSFMHISEDGRLWAPSVGQIDIIPAVNAFENFRMGVNYTRPSGNPTTREAHLIQAYPMGGQILYQTHILFPIGEALHPSVTQTPTFLSGLSIFSGNPGGTFSTIESSPSGFRKVANTVVRHEKELQVKRDTSRIMFGLSGIEIHGAGGWQSVDWKHKADTTVLGHSRNTQEEFRTNSFTYQGSAPLRFVVSESRNGASTFPANLSVQLQLVDAQTHAVLSQVASLAMNQVATGSRRNQVAHNLSTHPGRQVYLRLSMTGLDTSVSVLAHDIWVFGATDSLTSPKQTGDGSEFAISMCPTENALYQNWPNPFNPTSTIRYVLVQAGNVTLAVYDLVGRQRAILYSGYAESGLHSVSLDATQLESGTYYYRLVTAHGTLQRRMNVVK
ncbi:MAG: T9SS type A sorting domain-containing protein [Bacteroidia bacterium]|nr:T9SS type A sorting domain-containing protein [Bacteroidia bacterium]